MTGSVLAHINSSPSLTHMDVAVISRNTSQMETQQIKFYHGYNSFIDATTITTLVNK